MNKWTIFTNPGEIDPQTFMLMGVNVKPNGGIGQFGTGLKYAIAAILSRGGQILIHSGVTAHEFRTIPLTVRGQTFMGIQVISDGVPQTLHYTTELGKHWDTWMAFRELWSNMQDEDGELSLSDGPVSAQEGQTVISVLLGEFEGMQTGNLYILTNRQGYLYSTDDVELLQKQNVAVFYKNIRVLEEFKDYPSVYTYNITTQLELTEDRTIRDLWEAKKHIAKFWLECNSEEQISELFDHWAQKAEWHLPWDTNADMSIEFHTELLRRIAGRKGVPEKLRKRAEEFDELSYKNATLAPAPKTIEEMIDQAPEIPGRESRSNAYSAVANLEAERDRAVRAANFWRNCALKLANKDHEESAIRQTLEDGEIPF